MIGSKTTRIFIVATIYNHSQNIMRQPIFAKFFPSPFDQCWWVCIYHRDHAANKLPTNNINIGRERALYRAIYSIFWDKTSKNCVLQSCLRIFVTGCSYFSIKGFINVQTSLNLEYGISLNFESGTFLNLDYGTFSNLFEALLA